MSFKWMMLFFALPALFAGCSREVDLEQEKVRLLQTDREFSELSVASGTAEAFYQYMAEDGLALPQQGHPRNREAYRELAAQNRDRERRAVLKWEPILADIAASGDLGYTHGRYEFTVTDSLDNQQNTYGYYVSVWKKQPDGSWKFVFDAGNESPPPGEK